MIHLYNTHGVGGCLELVEYKLRSTHRVGVPQGECIPVQHSWDGGCLKASGIPMQKGYFRLEANLYNNLWGGGVP